MLRSMRRTTALKVLAYGYLFILVGAVLTEKGRTDLRRYLAGGVIIGFFLAVAWFRDRPRRGAMEAEARRLGLRYSDKDTFGLLDEPFLLFRRTRSSYGEIENVLFGTWHGFDVRVFDYEYMINEDNWRRLSGAVIAIPGGWPTIAVRPETLVSAVGDELALPGIEFESETFNRAFDVRSDDPAFASALIDARMMEWLLDHAPRPGFEISGRWILGYRDQVQPWQVDSVLAMLESFVDRIPRAVRSLYPEALPPRPDVYR
jgi:hypothetical protein